MRSVGRRQAVSVDDHIVGRSDNHQLVTAGCDHPDVTGEQLGVSGYPIELWGSGFQPAFEGLLTLLRWPPE